MSHGEVFLLADGVLLGVAQDGRVTLRAEAGGWAQVAAGTDRVYLLDIAQDGSGQLRFRALDLAGSAAASGHVNDAKNLALSHAGRGRIAAYRDRVLVLLNFGHSARVDVFDGRSLRYTHQIYVGSVCGDLLLASAARIGVACLRSGQVRLDDLSGTRATVPVGEIWQIAMAADGSVFAVVAGGSLVRVPAGDLVPQRVRTAPVSLAALRGLAALTATHAALAFDEPRPHLRVVDVASNRSVEVPLSGPLARRGLVGAWPFVYFVTDEGLQRIDVTTGAIDSLWRGRPQTAPVAATPR